MNSTEFHIGDTVLVRPDMTSLSGKVAGMVCYRLIQQRRKIGRGNMYSPAYFIYKLNSTGEITYDGSGFVTTRMVLTERLDENLQEK
jgi:hypothetical protein